MATAFGADSPGLSRLARLGAQRAKETGRAAPSEADLDWAVGQAKPKEISAWATPAGFAALEKGMASGGSKPSGNAEGSGGDMAGKKTKKGIGARVKSALGIGGGAGKKPGRGAAKRSAGGKAKGKKASPFPPKKKGFFARGVAKVKSAFGGKKKAAGKPKGRPFGGGARPNAPALPPMRRTVPVSLQNGNGMNLIEAKLNPATGVYEAETTAGTHHQIVRHSKGGGLAPSGKWGGTMQLFGLGATAIGGGALGMWLQTQDPVPIPMTSFKVRRGTIAFLAGLGITLAARKRFPMVARYAMTLTAGIGAGMAAERVRGGEGLTA